MNGPADGALFSLAQRTALVTGASRGIGAAVAVGLADAGADVALLARTREQLETVAKEVQLRGRQAMVVECDVTVPDDVEAACEEVLSQFGRVDVLVNNAGGPMFHAPFLRLRDDGWRRVIDLNLTSVFQFCRHIGAAMVACGQGSIINVASATGLRPVPLITPYCAAKAGVIALTQSLATEWGPHGVRVNAVCPGFVKTEGNRAWSEDDRLSETAIETVPLGRWAEPEEMIGSIVWLASEASKYVTGAIITVDGGFTFGVRQGRLDALNRSANPASPAST